MQNTVLVVDDDAGFRIFLASLLEDEGYLAFQASDGKRALERLRQHPTGLVVVLDLQMPVVSGVEVLRMVDGDASLRSRHAYIVLSSAQRHELPADLLGLLDAQQIPLLSKPCAPGELVTAVAAAAARFDGAAPPQL